MVLYPWMYLLLASAWLALMTVVISSSHQYIPLIIISGLGIIACLWMMRGSQKFYSRRW